MEPNARICKTSDRLKQLMELKKMKQAEILDYMQPYCLAHKITFGKSALSQYISGKAEPGQDKLMILSLAFKVSPAWLMGFNVPMDLDSASVWNGHNLRRIREQFGETCEQVAMIAGIPIDDYLLYENGISTPAVNVLHRLAEHFYCSIDFILEYDNSHFSTIHSTADLTPNEKTLIQNYRASSIDDRAKIDMIIKLLSPPTQTEKHA